MTDIQRAMLGDHDAAVRLTGRVWSMTRDEAIAVLEESKRQNEIMRDNPTTFWASYQMADGIKNTKRRIDALDAALTALRPVSREQVEKVWSGCEACKNAGLAIGEVQFYGPFEGPIDVSGNMQYCPNCGRPITPAAQEGQLERLEALKDGKGD